MTEPCFDHIRIIVVSKQKLEKHAEQLSALGHPARLGILRYVVQVGANGAAAGDIQSHLEIPPSTLSHHLERLASTGLLTARRSGTFIYCAPEFEALRALTDYLWEDCCKRGKKGCCYTPVELAFLFLFYEFFGVVTNLFGGWLAAHAGLRVTLLGGLAMQVAALGMLALVAPGWSKAVSVAYVMGAQSLSGIAKDLTKMSAKSNIKLLVPDNKEASIFKWVAVLTGSKNALKGTGFFLGGLLLAVLGYRNALFAMALGVGRVRRGSRSVLAPAPPQGHLDADGGDAGSRRGRLTILLAKTPPVVGDETTPSRIRWT